MRLLRPYRARPAQRGAALLLFFLVLIVIVMIVYQVNRLTSSERIDAERSVTLAQMDLAIQAAQLENRALLSDDAAQASAEGDSSGASGDSTGDGTGEEGLPADGEGGESGSTGPVDSYMDTWAPAQQSSIGEVEVVTFMEDEDRKFNVLNILSADPEEAQEAEAIIVRILDRCREQTTFDIDNGKASEMATSIRRFIEDRYSNTYPTPNRVDAEPGDPILPLSLRELVAIPPFEEHMFRDFFDERGEQVYAIDHFLTLYSSPMLGPSGTPTGGYTVNVNTAPLIVLAALFDSRDVNTRVWLDVAEYRRREADRDPNADEAEEVFRQNRFNEELPNLQYFESLTQVEEAADPRGHGPGLAWQGAGAAPGGQRGLFDDHPGQADHPVPGGRFDVRPGSREGRAPGAGRHRPRAGGAPDPLAPGWKAKRRCS
ncbi:MAG: hypothetical protein R3F17_07095 [Planctomycetota bacterium]